MTKLWIGICLAITTGAMALTAPGQVVTRAALSAEKAWIGERIRLTIDVLAPDAWAKIPLLPQLEIPGAHVIISDPLGTRLSETLSGQTASGQRYEYSLYPRREGLLKIPALSIEVAVRAFGPQAMTATSTHATAPMELAVRRPQGIPGATPFVTSPRLTLAQQWSPRDTSALKVGDALTRHVTLEADDSPALALPALIPTQLQGASLYPAQPSLRDNTDRGSCTATRTEAVTIIFKQAGTIVLPPVELLWFDPTSGQATTARVDGMTLQIAPSRDLSGPLGGPKTPRARHLLRGLLVILAIMTLLGVVVWRFRQRLVRFAAAQITKCKASEAATFGRVRKAARRHDAAGTWNTTMRWLDQQQASGPTLRLDQFADETGSPAFAAACAALAEALHAPAASAWTGNDYIRHLESARRQLRREKRAVRNAQHLLPPLNP